MLRWPIIMAGIAIARGYGAYRDVPEASWKSIGWTPNSMAVSKAARLMATYPAVAAARTRRDESSADLPAISV